MIEESASVGIDPSAEQRLGKPIKLWEVFFLVAFAAAILVAAYWQSSKVYFNNDELLTAVLVSNPHFSEMWHVIKHGGELNPPLFFVLEWFVAQTCGTSEVALRAISAVSVALTGAVLFFALRSRTGPRIAALAVALVLGLSREVFFFASDARYYGLLLLLVTLAGVLSLPGREARPNRRQCFFIWLVNCALVYLHLYGLLYSGVLFVAMLAGDWFRRKARWRLYGSVLAAWATFGAWVPSMRQQLKAVSGGVFVAPGMLTLGTFLDDLQLQTPLALILLVVVGMGVLSLMTRYPSAMVEEANTHCSISWVSWMLPAFAVIGVPLSTWLASHFLNPAPYMARYLFPCTMAWVFFVGFALLAVHHLPRPGDVPGKALGPGVGNCVWIGVLGFCILYQPLRAWKNPPRPAAPFVEQDFGHPNLPIVFENSWPYLQRAWYGHGREYVMLIDHDAAEADPGWYTKVMDRELKWFSPRYHKLRIVFYKDLPRWPDGFLAVDDDTTKTFEWIFSHHPELTTQLLGVGLADPPEFGKQRVYLVQPR